jgi:uncharacterized protein YicC (UPF0701 family)
VFQPHSFLCIQYTKMAQGTQAAAQAADLREKMGETIRKYINRISNINTTFHYFTDTEKDILSRTFNGVIDILRIAIKFTIRFDDGRNIIHSENHSNDEKKEIFEEIVADMIIMCRQVDHINKKLINFINFSSRTNEELNKIIKKHVGDIQTMVSAMEMKMPEFIQDATDRAGIEEPLSIDTELVIDPTRHPNLLALVRSSA